MCWADASNCVMFTEWSIGLSDNDSFIMRPVVIDVEQAAHVEMKEGYFWFNGEKSERSFLETGVRWVLSIEPYGD